MYNNKFEPFFSLANKYLGVSTLYGGLPGGSVVKNLLATARDTENSGLILSWEDPLEEEMATPPVFLPGEPHGQRSLVSYSPHGGKSQTRLSNFHFVKGRTLTITVK